ncbi:hypothetical protein [Geotalea sp. SG265]|uniref:hypothetical protein n=1 Tax=Geotalea sp. SG265 TaxID=2922867 RepID=UPI001FAFE355|nr:hypothetical protein [Geotalea sp. SG265]
MSDTKRIEVKVDYHESGRRTLKERAEGEIVWTDVKTDGLLGNTDSASFYRSVATRLANFAATGVLVVRYIDTDK